MASTIIKWYESNNALASYVAPTGGAQILTDTQYTFVYHIGCGILGDEQVPAAFPAPATYANSAVFGAVTPWGAGDDTTAGPILNNMDMTPGTINNNVLYKRQLRPGGGANPVTANGFGYKLDPGIVCNPGQIPVTKVYKVCGNGTSTLDQLLQTIPGVYNI